MAARTKARKRALDLLFEAEQRGVNAADLLRERLAAPVTEAPLSEFTADLVMGVVEHWGQLDELIATYAQGWTLEADAGRRPGDPAPRCLRGAVLHRRARAGRHQRVGGPGDRALHRRQPAFVNGLLARLVEVKPTLA